MTSRERLQSAYELAFHPPRLNSVWHQIAKHPETADAELGELLDQARLLHLALPGRGYSSQRALNRLALYQARARAFGMVLFLDNIRQYLGRPPLEAREVPGALVRDIGLPAIRRG